jgi:hypothetical protein
MTKMVMCTYIRLSIRSSTQRSIPTGDCAFRLLLWVLSHLPSYDEADIERSTLPFPLLCSHIAVLNNLRRIWQNRHYCMLPALVFKRLPTIMSPPESPARNKAAWREGRG